MYGVYDARIGLEPPPLIPAGAFRYRWRPMRCSPRFRPGGFLHALAGRTRGVVLVMAGCAMVLGSARTEAQQPPKPEAPPIVSPDTLPRHTTAHVHKGVSPRGALLRALALPGWGHSAIGAYKRGAFYFVAEGISAWGLIKTHERIGEAQRRIRFQDGVVRGDLAAQGITDPATIQTALDSFPALIDLHKLEGARKKQREDWAALGIFLVFLSGADAYVSAHLQHFPAPISIEAQPAGGGRYDLSLGVKLPLRRFRSPTGSASAPRPPPGRDTSGSAPSRPH